MLDIPIPMQEILSKLPKDHAIRVALKEGNLREATSFLEKEGKKREGKLSIEDISFIKRQILFLKFY